MKKRLFIAINFPDSVRDEAGRIQDILKKHFKNLPIKWVKIEKVHLTLHFLGYVDEERVEEIKDVIASVAKGRGAAKVRLGEIGFFPSLLKKGGKMAERIRPSVIFVETKAENRGLEDLQRDLGKELESAGMEIDRRAWRPHITLARLECPIETAIFEKLEIKPLKFEIKSVELMESKLKPEGAEYKVLKSYKLKIIS